MGHHLRVVLNSSEYDFVDYEPHTEITVEQVLEALNNKAENVSWHMVDTDQIEEEGQRFGPWAMEVKTEVDGHEITLSRGGSFNAPDGATHVTKFPSLGSLATDEDILAIRGIVPETDGSYVLSDRIYVDSDSYGVAIVSCSSVDDDALIEAFNRIAGDEWEAAKKMWVPEHLQHIEQPMTLEQYKEEVVNKKENTVSIEKNEPGEANTKKGFQNAFRQFRDQVKTELAKLKPNSESEKQAKSEEIKMK